MSASSARGSALQSKLGAGSNKQSRGTEAISLPLGPATGTRDGSELTSGWPSRVAYGGFDGALLAPPNAPTAKPETTPTAASQVAASRNRCFLSLIVVPPV